MRVARAWESHELRDQSENRKTPGDRYKNEEKNRSDHRHPHDL